MAMGGLTSGFYLGAEASVTKYSQVTRAGRIHSLAQPRFHYDILDRRNPSYSRES